MSALRWQRNTRKADRCRHYANMRDEINNGEVYYLTRLLHLFNVIDINAGDVSSARAYIDSLDRYMQLSSYFLDRETYLKSIDSNFQALIKDCKIFAQCYPVSFSVHFVVILK